MNTVDYLARANASPADMERVFELLHLMHAEIGFFTLSEPRVRAQMDRCLDAGYVAVVRQDGVIVATMGVQFTQQWYSEEWHLAEVWTFVHPDFRRSSHAKVLLQSAVEGAREVKRPITLGVFTDKRTEGKCRLFARQKNLKHVGQIFAGGL